MPYLLASLLLACPPFPPQSSEELPFERLGGALLEATAKAGVPGAPQGTAESSFLARLEPLCQRLDLGALVLWLPRHVIGPEGKLEDERAPKEWRPIAAALVEIERRWCAQLGELTGPSGPETALALENLASYLRRASAKDWPRPDEKASAAAARVRSALLGSPDARPLTLLVAPDRPHYLALIGAAGLFSPNQRGALWLPSARRSLEQPLGPSMLVLALRWGPPHANDPLFMGLPVDAAALREHVVHGASHLLANRLAPTAPAWLHEAIALLDTTTLTGADETLCSGYSGRPPTIFDGWREVPAAFFVFTRIESSPYRTGGSSDLFVDELRKARGPKGFGVLDLDRGRIALVHAGPFLGATARVPDEVLAGPRGLKEGFAEFFRAYCGAFAAWLAELDADGVSLLEHTLRTLRRQAADWDGASVAQLEAILSERTGLTLGHSLDPEHDLEGRFQAWLMERR